MARQVGRTDSASQARLQLILVALAAWNLVGYGAGLVDSSLLHVAVDGMLGGRAVSGASAVLALAYLYAARSPFRYRFVIWLAAVEQVVALFSMGFHWMRDDVTSGDIWLPMLAAAVFLTLLMVNLPRQTDTLRA